METNKTGEQSKTPKVFLITGASRGFGKLWAEAFLKRGDKVAATARNLDHLNDLVGKYGDAVLPIKLDVNSREQSIEAVKQAKDHFGRIDVLINNAGYGLFGAIEETTEQEAREQIETNFFGVLWATQAVLPIMREKAATSYRFPASWVWLHYPYWDYTMHPNLQLKGYLKHWLLKWPALVSKFL